MLKAPDRRGVGIFDRLQDAKGALGDLQFSGFPMERVSAIAKEQSPDHPPATIAGNKVQEGATTGAIAGGTVGGLMGLIAGLGTIAAVPGIGPIVLIGAAATALASTLTSGVMGATAGGLLGSLIGYGVPQDRAASYQQRIHQGGYLVIIEGSDAEMHQAEPILHRWQVQDWQVFDLPTGVPAHPPLSTADHRIP